MTTPGDDFLHTRLCELLGCRWPILQAGMGGPARFELAAAVAEAGGFGMLGMVREPPERIVGEVEALRARSDRPFAVNLIPAATEARLLEAELAACLECDVPAFCFFWDVRPRVIERVKQAGRLVLHQVGTLDAARQAEAAGADVLIAQGFEAGGHVHGRTGSLVFVEQVVRASTRPVVASGGFATGASLVAALALGAEGIQCGTAFLAARESFAHDVHKRRLVDARPEDTVHTDLYAVNWPPGSPVRVLANELTRGAAGALLGNHPDALPREVIAFDEQRAIPRFSTDSPLRTTRGALEAMALFAGESVAFVDEVVAAAQVVERIVAEAQEAIRRLERIAPDRPVASA